MEKVLADAFLNFYQKMLKPEFDSLKGKQSGHDERFSEVLGHLDAIYHRLGLLERGYSEMNGRLQTIEGTMESGNIDRSEIERRVKGVKEQFAGFQERLHSLERHLGD